MRPSSLGPAPSLARSPRRSPRRSLRLTLPAAAAAVVLTGTVAACGDDAKAPDAKAPDAEAPAASASLSESPSDSAPEDESTPAGPTLQVKVSGDQVTPVAKEVDLAVGEPLTIAVTSDREGELHVHSDPEHEYEFGSGTTTVVLTLRRPGSVDIEEHVSDALVARVLVR